MIVSLMIIGIVTFLGGIAISFWPGFFIKFFNLSERVNETEMSNIGYALGFVGLVFMFFSLNPAGGVR